VTERRTSIAHNLFEREGQKIMRKQDGFTLIELLVVIAIIALLLAILMPALQRVRKQAGEAACKANLHEWALVFVMYTDDNDGLLMDGYGGGIG
jgi:prepilin-type N-terminal cleavage/methylation domain-containing protein